MINNSTKHLWIRKLPFILCLTWILSACEQKDCCVAPPLPFPEIIVLNEQGEDLLAPDHPEQIAPTHISLWTNEAGFNRYHALEFNEPDAQSGQTYYSFSTSNREVDPAQDLFFLSLTTHATDTITLVKVDGRVTHFLLNHASWEQDNSGRHIIRKVF